MKWSDVFNYDPGTGALTNKSTRNSRAVAGGPAGGINKVSGYVMLMFNCTKYYAHRIAWDIQNPNDILTDGWEIDHINGVKHDNRAINLRKVKRTENQKNHPIRRNNTSGVTGVTFEKRTNKWDARIVVDGVSVFLGAFTTLAEAASARKAAEAGYGFHENHGRSHG